MSHRVGDRLVRRSGRNFPTCCSVPLKHNYIPIYTTLYPAKTAILRPDILAHTLLVTLGKDHSSAIITILSLSFFENQAYFQKILKMVHKKSVHVTQNIDPINT